MLGVLVLAPFLLGFVFFGAVVIGRRVAEPIEAAAGGARVAADASHELRTPLSVIEAHTSLALAQEREAACAAAPSGASTSNRSGCAGSWRTCSGWHASTPPPRRGGGAGGPWRPGRAAADRFAVVAETRSLRLGTHVPGEQVLIAAQPDLVDRLSACCWTMPASTHRRGDGGSHRGPRRLGVSVTVDDPGPASLPTMRPASSTGSTAR